MVGIDVGGPRKGFHAVALPKGAYLDTFASPEAPALAAWCIQVGARAVAIDAPCRWSRTGRARPAERTLAGKVVSARRKGVVRRELLRAAGIAMQHLTNIDVVDAALCALTAQALLARRFKAYGDAGEGFIVVPAWATTPTAGADPVEATAAGSVAC